MRSEYDAKLKAELTYDDDGRLREFLAHEIAERSEGQEIALERFAGAAETAQPERVAVAMIANLADRLGLGDEQVSTAAERLSYDKPAEAGLQLGIAQERSSFDGTTYGFQQTYLNVPVWGSGLSVTVKRDPDRVVSLSNTTTTETPDAKLPPPEVIDRWQALFAEAVSEQGPEAVAAATGAGEAGESDETHVTAAFVRRLAGGEATGESDDAKLIRGRFFVYRYAADDRTAEDEQRQRMLELRSRIEAEPAATGEVGEEEPLQQEPALTLPLAPVAEPIRDGQWYLVAEVTFTLTTPGHGKLTWLALVELETESVLYLRALASGVTGLVFERDPISQSGNPANMPGSTNAVLNAFRSATTLKRLVAAGTGTAQKLNGKWVKIAGVEDPPVAAPTRPAGSNFDFNARSNEFAAVSAYVHSDRVFEVIESLGFSIASYFNNTSFPVAVDHRGLGEVINAHCVGNGMGGIGHCCYGLNDTSNTAEPIGRACDSRVHWHELCGHGILYEFVNFANFGFAHSAGDSLSLIYHDPDSKAPDRFRYAPWHPTLTRHCNRPVNGWGWGGQNDDRGYGSEQILATCMFRIYRSIGGDSSDPKRKKFASEMMMYLILRTISTLTPATNPNNATAFANALMATELLNWTSHGIFGGAYGKVIRWSFEKQGLWRAAGAPATVQGKPPPVDVYIEDGRGGEYPFQPDHKSNPSIWNRHAPDGQQGHQEPVMGRSNFAYVKLRNRGTKQANNVGVRAFHTRTAGSLVWPNAFEPLTTANLPGGSIAPNNTEEKIVGPFAWKPRAAGANGDHLLMVASADDDPSNIANFTAGETVEDWRLVPNDNNIGMRAVTPSV